MNEFKKTITAGIFIFFYTLCVAQNSTFKGKIEYSFETLLSSGTYKEFPGVIIYFNETVYCFQQVQKLPDIDTRVAAGIKMLMDKNKNYNIVLDSFEIERQRRKLKAQMTDSQNVLPPPPINFISYNTNISTMPRNIGDSSYCVTDTISRINWVLLDDTMTIQGLLCQKARGVISDKFYQVWFTSSIPFSAGPPLMYGLPGIIVLAISEDKKRRYKMIKLEYPLSSAVEFTGCTNEKKISKSDFFQLQEKYRKERQQKREELKKTNQY